MTPEEQLRASREWITLPKAERTALLKQVRLQDRIPQPDQKPTPPQENPFVIHPGMTPEEATREKIRLDAKQFNVKSGGPRLTNTFSTPQPWFRDQASAQASGTVYVIQDIKTRLYKIGRTRNMKRRMRELGVGSTARLINSRQVSDAAKAERAAHKRYKSARLPQSEYFKLNSPPVI